MKDEVIEWVHYITVEPVDAACPGMANVELKGRWLFAC
jgi:hypothetical protein